MIQYDFTGKVAFVLGGTSGIGLAAARAFARAGAKVAIAARRADAGERARDAIGGDTLFVRADSRSEADVAGAVSAAVARFGRLDMAFNCAGVGGDMAPLESTHQETWDDVMATNARGIWLAM